MKPKAADSRAVANYIVQKAAEKKRPLSIMQLVKLVYVSHGWSLALLERPLIKHGAEAWKFGPVVPEVYHAFRPQGVTVKGLALDDAGEEYTHKFSQEEKSIIDQVFDQYVIFGAFGLSQITHQEGSPWKVASDSHGYWAPISNDVIEKHYKELSTKVAV